MLNAKKINELFREREMLMKTLQESELEFTKQIDEVSSMAERGQCTKEQFYAYYSATRKRQEELEAPIVLRLTQNMKEIRENAMVSPLEFAQLIEVGLYKNHRFDEMYRGFKRGSQYKDGDKLHKKAKFLGFYEMWEKEGTAMAFVPKTCSETIKLSINDNNSLIFHTTAATVEEHKNDPTRTLIRDELICLFQDPMTIKYGKDKPEDMVIPFRLSIDGRADAFHANEFNNDIAKGIFEYLAIRPFSLSTNDPVGKKTSTASAPQREQ